MEITYNWALITGASGSLGQALAFKLAESKWSLILHYSHNTAACAKLAKQLTDLYPDQKFILWQADFTDLSSLENSCREILAPLSKLNLLVNIAALDNYAQVDDLTSSELEDILKVNVGAPLILVKVCLGKLKLAAFNKEMAQIINISSIWANYGASMEVAYSASKGAINSMTKALAKELYSFPIKVNAVAPGMFTSSMNERFSETEQSTFVNEHSLLQRQASANEIADVINFLASDKASYINGQILEVSGSYL